MRPKCRLRGLDRRLDLLPASSTSSPSASPVSRIVLDEVGDLGRVARRDDGAIAAREQDFGELAAEAGRAAGDEPDGFFTGRTFSHGDLV